MQHCQVNDNKSGITVVTVTYGDRWQYLRVLLQLLEKEPLVHDVVVVDNASMQDMATVCVAEGFIKPHVIRLDQNMGSAGGYKAGIEAALALPGDYIVLYDDDVVPTSGSLEHLRQEHNRLTVERSPIAVALISYRESQHGKLIIHRPPLRFMDDHFLGLNIFNFFERHFSRQQPIVTSPEAAYQNKGVAYAGLFFHKSLISLIGLPNSNFIVYYDDVEFTSRFLTIGGEIWLDTKAFCEDITDNYSMNIVELPFLGFMFADSDSKVYYLIRNRIYFDRHTLCVRSIATLINMLIFMIVIILLCCITFKIHRLIIILKAIKDGYQGNLGMHPDFPLS